jgi:hypothetical protein
MALDTVTARLEQDFYVAPEEVINDLRMVFCDAMRFNDENSDLYQHAAALYYVTGTLWAKVTKKQKKKKKMLVLVLTCPKKLAPTLPAFPHPFERGTVDDYINLADPVVMERIHHAFATGVSIDPNANSYDPSQPISAPISNKKKTKPKTSSASKRGRKDLKVVLFVVVVFLFFIS